MVRIIMISLLIIRVIRFITFTTVPEFKILSHKLFDGLIIGTAATIIYRTGLSTYLGYFIHYIEIYGLFDVAYMIICAKYNCIGKNTFHANVFTGATYVIIILELILKFIK